MTDLIIELVLDESKWLSTAMLLSIFSVGLLIFRQRRLGLSRRLVILRAMHLFYGCMIGIMAFGHLLAVTLKAALGTLEGSLWLLSLLGLALAIPAGCLAASVRWLTSDEERVRKRALVLNLWLGISLLGLGLHNAPLAAPAALNIAYQAHSRRAVGWLIVAVTAVAYLGLFIGSLVFFASGQSFEQFSGTTP